MRKHRNTGAAHRRADGSFVQHGEVFTPTERELKSFSDKFKPLEATYPEPPAPVGLEGEPEAPGGDGTTLAPDLDQYARGGGHYDIPGVGKFHGRKKAEAALREHLGLGDEEED